MPRPANACPAVCVCDACRLQVRIADLLRVALDRQGLTANSFAQIWHNSTVWRIKRREHVGLATLAKVFAALECELVINLRPRQKR